MVALQCCVGFSRQQRESANTYIPSLLSLLLTPRPSPSHTSQLSQSTGLSSVCYYIKQLPLAICFTHGSVYMSVQPPQLVPLPPSLSVSIAASLSWFLPTSRRLSIRLPVSLPLAPSVTLCLSTPTSPSLYLCLPVSQLLSLSACLFFLSLCLHAHRGGHVRIQQEDDHLQTRKKDLTINGTHSNLDLGLSSLQSYQKINFYSSRLVVFFYGSPS